MSEQLPVAWATAVTRLSEQIRLFNLKCQQKKYLGITAEQFDRNMEARIYNTYDHPDDLALCSLTPTYWKLRELCERIGEVMDRIERG